MRKSKAQTKGEKSKRTPSAAAISSASDPLPSSNKRSRKVKASIDIVTETEEHPTTPPAVHVSEESDADIMEEVEEEEDPRFRIDEDSEIENEFEDLDESSQEEEDITSSRDYQNRPMSPFEPPPGPGDNLEDDEDEENAHPDDHNSRNQKNNKLQGGYKPGILYLSSIPPGYNVSRTTAFFAQYGKVGRVFLQPDQREKVKSKDGLARNFTEGWIEYMSKGVAKNVAMNLNSTPVGGKKRSKAHDVLWNIKYLSKFKWTHLTERLAYEKAVHHQKMRAEISQAKREADNFKQNLDKSTRLKRKLSKLSTNETTSSAAKKVRKYEFRQKETDVEVLKSKKAALESSNSAAVKAKSVTKNSKNASSKGNKKRKQNLKAGSSSKVLKNVFSAKMEGN